MLPRLVVLLFFLISHLAVLHSIEINFFPETRPRDQPRDRQRDPNINPYHPESFFDPNTRPWSGSRQVEGYTRFGYVRGTAVRIESRISERYIAYFLGIPYAMPPIQDLRFMRPRDPPEWRPRVYDGTYYRDACPQTDYGKFKIREVIPDFPYRNFSEDCLHLNVFSPHRMDDPRYKYPVMIFIHGGGFVSGTAQMYPAYVLAQRDVVVVTFNYRLGPLGFLSTQDDNAPGNMGLWDQLHAMKFVRENIEHFNGDPNQVTIFGHGAGGASVGFHTLSEQSYNFFQKAIMMSGSDTSPWAYIPQKYPILEFARNLSRAVGCFEWNTYKMVYCLRQRSATELMETDVEGPAEIGGHAWKPVVDEFTRPFFLGKEPRVLRRLGEFNKVPLIGGLSRDEGALRVQELNLRDLGVGMTELEFDDQVRKFVNIRVEQEYDRLYELWRRELRRDEYRILKYRDFLNENGIFDIVKNRYTWHAQPDNLTQTRQMLVDLFTDYEVTGGIDEVLKANLRYARTWMYVFEHRSERTSNERWMGASHGEDLQYVFGIPFLNESFQLQGYRKRHRYTPEDEEMSNYTMHLWANFAKFGQPTPKEFLDAFTTNLWIWTPSSGYRYVKQLNISWIAMLPNNLTYLAINGTPYTTINFRQSEGGFWRDLFSKLFETRITTTPTPLYLQAVLDHRDTTIVMWIMVGASTILLVATIVACVLFCRRPKYVEKT